MRFLVFYFCVFISLSSCFQSGRDLPYYNSSNFKPIWEIPKNTTIHTIRNFSLIDQNGKTFTQHNIENNICIVDFFYTSCPGICVKMKTGMQNLQQKISQFNNVLLLSHSVNPEEDSVSVLANYAKVNKVNYTKWKLLTGNKKEIYNLGRKYYFIEEDLGEDRSDSVFLHTENFVLIDKNKRIRGIYNGLDPSSLDKLYADLIELKKNE